jgi:hypothetical protein
VRSSAVLVLLEAEARLVAAHQDRPLDQVGLFHHEIDRFLLRARKRALLEYRASRADEIQESIRGDVALQERTIGRFLVDVALDEFDPLRIQKTSGVTAGRSSGLPVKD